MGADVETVTLRSGDLDLYGRLYSRGDEAPTIVLLSGLGFHTFEYEPLATALGAAGISALSFDFRGHGRSAGPRGRWTLDELAADCGCAIDFAWRRNGGPVVLFGNSLGAMIAILTGARDDRPLGVVAANTPARIGDFLLTRPRRALFALA
ncbi:MAG: alpha/beta hydrolase [Solirubrobacterales bacterium]